MKGMIKKLQQILCLLALVYISTSAAHAEKAQDIAKKAFSSTMLLVMEDVNGKPFSFGSGFLIRDGEIATNLHVIEGAVKGYAKLIGRNVIFGIEGITAIDSKRDLAILKIDAIGLPKLSLGSSDAIQVGETIYAVGNPKGLEGTFSQGIVSSIRKVDNDYLLQITAPISPGSSGGPVLNEKGKVIGVSVATFKDGQNLNFAIPSNYLKELLANVGPVKPLAHLTSAKQPLHVITKPESDTSQTPSANSTDSFRNCSDCPEMVRIPGKNYEIGKYEVTRAEFAKFVAATGYRKGNNCRVYSQARWIDGSWLNPGFNQDNTHPVVCVSWDDAQAYIFWLSTTTGINYRLPTKDEWQFSCLAGNKTMYCGGDDINSVAWYRDNSGYQTHPVGQKQPNGFGLYDMSGNAGEWTDSSGGSKHLKALAGGSWNTFTQYIGAAHSEYNSQEAHQVENGFRLARTLP